MLTIQDPLTLDDLSPYEPPASPAWAAKHSRWAPVQHADLVNAVLRGAERRGMVADEQAWQLTQSGHGLVGTISFRADARWPSDVVPSIVVRHSNIGRHAVTLAIGAQVIICSNGLLLAEVVTKRLHTTGLDLDDLVREGLDTFVASGPATTAFIDRLRATYLSKAERDQLLLASARRAVVPWSMLKHVDRALSEAPSPDMAEPTAWGLYNAYTQAIKRRSGVGQHASLHGLAGLFSEASIERELGEAALA